MAIRHRMLLALAAALVPTALTAQAPFGAGKEALIGSYFLMRQGADSLQQLELRLYENDKVTLTTEFPGYTKTAAGTPVLPVREYGTWQDAGGFALVHLSKSAQLNGEQKEHERGENVTLFFKLSGCTLKLAQDPTNAYGSQGLTFKRHHCGSNS